MIPEFQNDHWMRQQAPKRVHFCAGRFCPGYHWPASNTPHPTSCAIERLNSAENLREAYDSRRAHGRDVSAFSAKEQI